MYEKGPRHNLRRRLTVPPASPTQRSDTQRSPALRSLPVDVERLARAAAGLALSLYVLGLIAVNGYLFQLNVSDFSLVRARFIYTGALLVTFGVLPYLIYSYIVQRFPEYWNPGPPIESLSALAVLRIRSSAILWLALGLSLPIFCLMLGVYESNDYSGVEGWIDSLNIVFRPYVFGLLVAFLSVVAYPQYLAGRNGGWPNTQVVRYSLFLLAEMFFLALYISIFMQSTYPHIPEQFGGGRPSTVQLLVKKDDVSGARELGIPVPKTKQLSDRVTLLYEGSDSYVLQLSGGKIVSIDKNMIAGVITRQ
jgi:hypothetical protein